MPTADPRTGFRFSYLILGFSVVAAVGSYAYSLWIVSQQEKAMLPRPAVDHLVKALRTYHKRAGSFPQTLAELETKGGRQNRGRTFGEDGRSLTMANYYYIYHLVDARVCTLWAIPINKRSEEGSTFFLALSPEAVRRWKGAALALDEIKRLPAVPDPAQLALLGLTEQQAIPLNPSSTRRKAAVSGK
jgi:hypothetical protein